MVDIGAELLRWGLAPSWANDPTVPTAVAYIEELERRQDRSSSNSSMPPSSDPQVAGGASPRGT